MQDDHFGELIMSNFDEQTTIFWPVQETDSRDAKIGSFITGHDRDNATSFSHQQSVPSQFYS
jgi:hypothetical protein